MEKAMLAAELISSQASATTAGSIERLGESRSRPAAAHS